MNLLHALLELDASAFRWINSGWSNAFLDAVLPLFREKWFWAPFYLFIVAFAAFNFGKKARWVYIGILLTVALADVSSSSLIKKQVKRLRPCNDPAMSEWVVQRAPCGGGYSFTSSHACNHFAVAVFLIGVFGQIKKWIKPALLLWAGSIALAQVYVGVHYPLDIAVGGLLGAGIGRAVFLILRKRLDWG